ncbi:TPA: hypothetical protein NN539_004695 [Salmonella enterica]|nr:hypothetical protein [Salmonella enterica]
MKSLKAILFALIFVLSNAYAEITWIQDTITRSEFPINSVVGWIGGDNGTALRTWVGNADANINSYDIRCETTPEKAMSKASRIGTGFIDSADIVGNAGTLTSNNRWFSLTYNIQVLLKKPESNKSFRIYCLAAPTGYTYNTSPEEVRNAENIGIIYDVLLSTVTVPVLSTTGSLDLGDVRRDETVTRPVPVSMAYAGGTDSGKTLSGNVTWVITPATDNPSPLMPVIKKGGVSVESFTVSLTNAQIQSDDFTVSLTGNEYPGAYSWTMNITTTIE